MIVTLLITILIEGVVVVLYCTWRRKPFPPIFITSVAANTLTQVLLWIVLQIFFQHYLRALFISEFLLWTLEGIILHRIAWNRLSVREAILLSLGMNLCSFGIGIFLPI